MKSQRIVFGLYLGLIVAGLVYFSTIGALQR